MAVTVYIIDAQQLPRSCLSLPPSTSTSLAEQWQPQRPVLSAPHHTLCCTAASRHVRSYEPWTPISTELLHYQELSLTTSSCLPLRPPPPRLRNFRGPILGDACVAQGRVVNLAARLAMSRCRSFQAWVIFGSLAVLALGTPPTRNKEVTW